MAIWLAFEAASLSALVPRDCCAAHRPAAASAAEGCHESAAAVQRCAARATGPMAALFAQLSTYGVLTDAYRLHPDFLQVQSRPPRESGP